jgi:bifunctional non-homologous end joining protein LigD
MEDAVRKDGPYHVSGVVEDGTLFFEAVKNMGLEGIMAKLPNSRYLPGKRSESWLKVKTRRTMDCAIIGYTRGKGDRAASFGGLHLRRPEGDHIEYVGKVGTGFDDRSLEALSAQLQRLTRIRKPIKKKMVDDARSIWVEPKLACEVQFASITKSGVLREPVFLRLRPDLTFKT